MHRKTTPVQTFSVFWWLIEDRLQVFDALSTATKPEDTLRLGRIVFKEKPAFCDDDGNVSVDERLAIVIVQGDGDVRISYAFLERYTEYTFAC